MEFEGEIEIDASSEHVWELASDPEVLMSCVPGAEEITQLSETKYEGTIKRGVAGVSISLEGEAEIVELNPPSRIVANASGQDAMTNSRMEADAELSIEANGDASVLSYAIDLDFTGRLASLGSRIVKRQINSDINTFFSNLKDRAEDDA